MSVTVTLVSTSDDVVVTLISTALESGESDMPQPTSTAPIAAGASPTTINPGGYGFIFGVIVTTPAAAPIAIRSGSVTGTIVAYVPANFPGGAIPFPTSVPYTGGLYIGSGTNSPAITVLYT